MNIFKDKVNLVLLRTASEHYWEELTKRCKHRGVADTIKFLKLLHLNSVKLSLGIKMEAFSNIKLDKSGYPSLYRDVKTLLTGNKSEKMAGLTITKLYMSLRIQVDSSTESITSPYTGLGNLGDR